VKGCVGDAAGNFFIKFIQDYKGLEVDLPGFVGKEDEFRLPYPDRHDHVSQIMASIVYYLEEDPKKYMKLWIQVVNVLYNKGNAYGNYAGYNNLVMKYLFNNIRHLLESKALTPDKMEDLQKRMPAYDLLGLVGT